MQGRPRSAFLRLVVSLNKVGCSVVLAALLGIVAAMVAEPASAHTGFESSQPGDGERSDVPVAEIVITFSGPADPVGEGFVVLDPAGAVRMPDSFDVDAERQRWTLGFDPPLAGGVVGVRWTVQAPDAHPINGGFRFTAGDPVSPTTPMVADGPTPSGREPTGRSASGPAQLSTRTGSAQSGTEAGPIDLDAFLSGDDGSAAAADAIGAIGRFFMFVGTMLAIGGLAFATVVVGDHRDDRRLVLRAVGFASSAIVVGTVVDLVAVVAVATGGWGEVVAVDGFEVVATSSFGVAVGLRAAAGVLLFLAVRRLRLLPAPAVEASAPRELVTVATETTGQEAVGAEPTSPGTLASADRDEASPSGRPLPPAGEPGSARRPLKLAILVAVAALLVSWTFDGHTATEGERWVTATVDVFHITAASIWAGGVFALSLVLWFRHRRAEHANALPAVLRFSTIAGASVAVAGLAGLVLAVVIIDQPSQLWSTPWGRVLIVKTLAVAAAAAVGAYNHFVMIPWLDHDHDHDSAHDAQSVRILTTVIIEAFLLAAVLALTAFLVGASVTIPPTIG